MSSPPREQLCNTYQCVMGRMVQYSKLNEELKCAEGADVRGLYPSLPRVPKLPMFDACVFVCVWYDLGAHCSMWCQAMRFEVTATAPLAACEKSKDISIGSQR